MNVSLSPEEFVELYSTLTASTSEKMQDLRNKMTTILVETLTSVNDETNKTKFPHWLKREQEKVADLETQLKSITSSSDDGLPYPPAQSRQKAG